VPNRGSAALAQRDDLDSIYWGGALFCFAADVRIREETHGKRSLDDVLREALAHGGDATKVWTVAEVVKLGDDVTGTTVLSEMYQRYAARGDRIDLDGLLASLGIDRSDDGTVDLDDRRTGAWIRRAIIGGGAGAGSAQRTGAPAP
jgi:predicted metalloprotease with PDZ domain